MQLTRKWKIWIIATGVVVVALAVTACSSGKVATPTEPASSGSNLIALNVPIKGSGGFNYTQGTYLEGFQFTANKPISITQLGAYDSNYSSLSNGKENFAPTEVAVYNLTTHILLGSITVKSSDPVTGVYHYASLATPIALNTTNNYAVAWVSGPNYYVASPALTLANVNSAITYVGFTGNGSGGLTQTSKMVEPNWFYSELKNGSTTLGYDLGPNFMFVSK